MTLLAVIRHGPTNWNEEGRLQGHHDAPLSQNGRELVLSWRIPDNLLEFRWITSPLKRAIETAKLVSDSLVTCDNRLVEMDWAQWEGRKLVDIRAELGPAMTALEEKGLDFRPPDGESPREVQLRLQKFMADYRQTAEPSIAVCHKGVIRALYALATDWDMKSSPPQDLHPNSVHLFRILNSGPKVEQLNISLIGEKK